MKHETITPKDLADLDNITECECGNATHYDYSWDNDNGETSCPVCMVDWQSQQIEGMKQLLYQLSSKSKEETAKAINEKYAEMIGVSMDDLEEMNLNNDFSKIY